MFVLHLTSEKNLLADELMYIWNSIQCTRLNLKFFFFFSKYLIFEVFLSLFLEYIVAALHILQTQWQWKMSCSASSETLFKDRWTSKEEDLFEVLPDNLQKSLSIKGIWPFIAPEIDKVLGPD